MKRKLFSEYNWQVINHAKKVVLYTDDDKLQHDHTLEVYPIDMRKKIDASLDGYKIKTQKQR